MPTPCQTLTGKQKSRHVLGQVGQRRQLLRQRNQQFADVIACRYTMPVEHGVDDLARSEHVRRKVREGGSKGVVVGLANACQQSGGEGTAGKTVVVMLCDRHAVDVDDSRRGIVGVSLEHVEGWAIAINRGLAGTGLVRFTGIRCHLTSVITRVRAPVTSCMAHMLRAMVSTFSVHVSKL